MWANSVFNYQSPIIAINLQVSLIPCSVCIDCRRALISLELQSIFRHSLAANESLSLLRVGRCVIITFHQVPRLACCFLVSRSRISLFCAGHKYPEKNQVSRPPAAFSHRTKEENFASKKIHMKACHSSFANWNKYSPLATPEEQLELV